MTNQVKVTLTAENKQAVAALDQLQKAAKDTAGHIAGSFGPMGSFFASIATGPVAIAAAFVALGVSAFNMAGDVEHAGRRINAVFPGIVDEARPLSNEFGVAQTAVLHLFDTIEAHGPGSKAGLEAMTRATLEFNQALA